jgi:DNA end-binding protein Ku
VEDFVAWDEIDPMHFESTYWVVPDDSKGAKQAYALLRDAMAQAAKVAVGRFVMRTKEHLVVLRPVEGAIALHGMLFPDEVVPPKKVEGLPVRVEAADGQVEMAQKLIDSLTVDWDPNRYRDTHRAAVENIIARKAKGEEIVVEPQANPTEPMSDLMAALEASLAGSSRWSRSAGSSGSGGRRRPRRAAASRKRSSPAAAGDRSSGKRRTSRNRKS